MVIAAVSSVLVIALSFLRNTGRSLEAVTPTCTRSVSAPNSRQYHGGKQASEQQTKNKTFVDKPPTFVTLNRNDHVYKWFPGHPPIVVESQKLIFFAYPKVATTTWKKLFRRMEGYDDWKTANPHIKGGLVHLTNLNMSYAEKILNSPDYTRAVIVRDPKERFVSAWFDKAKAPQYLRKNCCKNETECPNIQSAQRTITGFIELAKVCQDRHWNPYTMLTDKKWLSKINFVGHFETLESDARRLLERIGAWDDYGATGWGLHGDEPIFSSRTDGHSTSKNIRDSWDRLSKVLTPETEMVLEDMYADDYNSDELELPLKIIFDSGPCS